MTLHHTRTQSPHHLPKSWLALIFLSALPFGSLAKPCTLTHLSVSKVPLIIDNRMSYIMNLRFDPRPTNYWGYFDPKTSSIIIDFYGDSLRNNVPSIPYNLVFKQLTIRNTETALSLTQRHGQVSIAVDPGWNFALSTVGSDTVQVRLSRTLSIESSRTQTPNRWGPFLISSAMAGVVSVMIIALIGKTNI